MEVSVDGWRSGLDEWKAARAIPREQLPVLSEAQKTVARKLGISEDDYARSAFAGERTRDQLLKKTERLARVLEKNVKALEKPVEIRRVTLRTIDHRFDVDLKVNGDGFPVHIEESLVDDYFDSGSEEAEERLSRILVRAFESAIQ